VSASFSAAYSRRAVPAASTNGRLRPCTPRSPTSEGLRKGPLRKLGV
jgi:hypothetical protein